MTEFKWTPEAIPQAACREALRVSFEIAESEEDAMAAMIAAALPHLPVVALPPCPTCKGARRWTEGSVGPQTGGMEPTGKTHACPTCDGSGVERLIPESEIRAWIDGQRDILHSGRPGDLAMGARTRAMDDVLDRLQRRLDEREARP